MGLFLRVFFEIPSFKIAIPSFKSAIVSFKIAILSFKSAIVSFKSAILQENFSIFRAKNARRKEHIKKLLKSDCTNNNTINITLNNR
jgi:hypothetical protein